LEDLVIRWRRFVREQVAAAQAAGDLDIDCDAVDLVSVLNRVVMSANQELQLVKDRSVGPRAKRIMLRYLAICSDTRQPLS